MSTPASTNETRQIYRIDKFKVPGSARQEFMDRVHSTHEFLRTLPDFVQDSVLEQTGGPGEFNIVTIAIWDSPESIKAAGKAVTTKYEEIGFNPQEMLARLGIKADLANYRQLV
jgi:hypothetical protein